MKEEEIKDKAPGACKVTKDDTDDEEIQIKEEVDIEEDDEILLLVTEVGSGRGTQQVFCKI